MKTFGHTSRLAAALACLILISAGACGSGDTATQAAPATEATVLTPAQDARLDAARAEAERPVKTFVGKVDGTDAYAAVVDDGVNLSVYFCDGGGLGLWFTAPSAGDAEATHASGASFRAVVGDADVTGEVTIDGESHSFVALPATYPAGLWQGFVNPKDEPLELTGRHGWIVLPDGSQRGSKVQSTATSAASELDTATGTGEDGTAATPSTPPPPTTTGLEDTCISLFSTLRKLGKLHILEGDATKSAGYLTAYLIGLRGYNLLGCQDVTGLV